LCFAAYFRMYDVPEWWKLGDVTLPTRDSLDGSPHLSH
jgi:hypothetical protein